MSTPIRALIFDVGNTLLRINHTVIADTLSAHGHAVSPAAVYAAECRARPHLDTLATRGLPPREVFSGYFQALCAHLELPWDATTQSALDDIRAYDRQHSLWDRATAGARSALQRLRQAGYQLGVISNSDGSAAMLLARQGLEQFFPFVIDSFHVGVEKPAPRIFQLALARTRTAAEETVYVGDLYGVDVLGARGVGMHGVLVDPLHAWRHVDCPKIRDLRQLPAVLARWGQGPEAR